MNCDGIAHIGTSGKGLYCEQNNQGEKMNPIVEMLSLNCF